MPSSTLWTLLILLPAIPIALLYAQRRTTAPEGLSKGQKKRAKRAKRAAGTVSSELTTVSTEKAASLASHPAAPLSSKPNKNRRKKRKTEAAEVVAVPGAFDVPAVPPTTSLAPPDQAEEWQTPRKNKSRAPKPEPVASQIASQTTDAQSASTASAPSRTPVPSTSAPSAPPSTSSPAPAPAPAEPAEEPIDWGADADRNWTADAQWGTTSAPAQWADESDGESDQSSDSGFEPVPMPSSRGVAQREAPAGPPVAAPAKRRKNKKPPAELHPSEFFAPPPVTVSAPVEAEWASVPTRAARAAPGAPTGASSGSAASRFSSKNAFAMLHEEGEAPLHRDGSAAKVIRIASSAPKPKAEPRRAAVPASEPTKKQRQNAARRDAAKLAREEAERERVAALAAHRRARAAPVAPPKKTGTFGFSSAANQGLDKATLLQLAQGSRKQPSNGQRAQVDAKGNLVWQ